MGYEVTKKEYVRIKNKDYLPMAERVLDYLGLEPSIMESGCMNAELGNGSLATEPDCFDNIAGYNEYGFIIGDFDFELGEDTLDYFPGCDWKYREPRNINPSELFTLLNRLFGDSDLMCSLTEDSSVTLWIHNEQRYYCGETKSVYCLEHLYTCEDDDYYLRDENGEPVEDEYGDYIKNEEYEGDFYEWKENGDFNFSEEIEPLIDTLLEKAAEDHDTELTALILEKCGKQSKDYSI